MYTDDGQCNLLQCVCMYVGALLPQVQVTIQYFPNEFGYPVDTGV